MLPDAEKYTVKIGGAAWDGWEAMTVGRSMQAGAGTFTLELSRKQGSITLDGVVNPFAEVAIEIDGTPVLVGYLDQLKGAFDARSSTITATGRDKIGDLVDCAATVATDFDYRGQKLDKVVAAVIKPFGLSLSVAGDVGAAFDILSVQPGETAFAFIERACRFRQLMPLSDGIGGIVLVKPAGEKSPGRIIAGDNALSASSGFDATGVFSLYVIKGQTAPSVVDAGADNDAELLATPEGRATDKGVPRYRPTVIVSENNAIAQTLTERAAWSRKMAVAHSRTANYVVQGWYAASGQLWKPNTVVRVTDARLGLDRDMLVTGVTFSRDNSSGTRTTLDLALPEAFDIEPYRNDAATEAIWVSDPDE